MLFRLKISHLLTMALIAFCLNSMHAQKKMEYGISLGVISSDYRLVGNRSSRTNQIGKLQENFEPMLNPSVGIRIGRILNENTKFTIGPSIIWLGAAVESSFSDEKSSGVYISLPVLLQRNFGKHFSINGGFNYDYLLQLNGELNGIKKDVTENASNRHFLGLETGMSLHLSQIVELGLSYNHGLTDIDFTFHDAEGNPRGQDLLKNKYLEFKVILRQ